MKSCIKDILLKFKLIPRLVVQAPYSGAIVLLQCASAFFSIVGIPLLIPVLDYLKDGRAAGDSKVLAYLQQVLAWAGLPVNFASLLIVSGVLFLLGQVLLTVSTLVAIYAQAELARKWRYKLFDGYGHVDWLWLLNARSGEINYFVLREVETASVAHLNSQRVVIYSIQMVVLLGIALKLSWAVTLTAAVVYGLIAVANTYISRFIIRAAEEYQQRYRGLANDLFMIQQNKKFFKTSLLNLRMTGAVNGIVGRIAYLTKHENNLIEFQRMMGMVIIFSFLLCVMYFHGRLGLNYSELLVILFIFSRIAPSFSQLSAAFATLDSNIPAYNSVQARLKDLDLNQETNGREVFSPEAPIRIEGVSFSYPNGKNVLSGVNLKIEPKRTTAILGPSGSGKSTMLDLILGLLKPTTGAIFYGDVHHDQLDKNSLRRMVAYVSQDTTLVDGTLEENLSIRLDGHKAGEMEAVLAKTGLSQVVAGLPQGLATPIGENGVKLSGGQRQRVALARALLMAPEILILDEATSNLDADSEKAIMETIKALKNEYTIIIVTHRMASVNFADKIYALNEMTTLPTEGKHYAI